MQNWLTQSLGARTRAGKARGMPHSMVVTHSSTSGMVGSLRHHSVRPGDVFCNAVNNHTNIESLYLTRDPGSNDLLPGQSVGGSINPAKAGVAGGHGGLEGVVVGGAVQVVTDVLEVLVPHDGPDGSPPLGHVLAAVLGVRVLGAGLGDQDQGLAHQVLLGGEEVGGGVTSLFTLVTGPVLGRGQGEHGGKADENLVNTDYMSVNTTSERQVVSTFIFFRDNQK